MQKIKIAIRNLLLGLFLMLMIFPTEALAAGPIDTDRDVALTINYNHEGQPISGAEFRLYKVATVDAYGAYTPADWFASYPIYTEGLDLQGWRSLALTLSGYVLRDNIPATDSGRTGTDGLLIFPTASSITLKPGLYLITSVKHTFDGYTYTAAPFLVALPSPDKTNNTWNYTLTISPKHDREKEPEKLTRKVLKVWDDQDNENSRPENIMVDLLRDGEIFDTVTLNKRNNWRFTWTDLDGKYEWTVVEHEVSGYTVKVDKTGATYIITNTKNSVPPVTPPTTPEKPSPKLPQTGPIWWPVQVLAVLGIVLIIIGILRRRGDKA